MNTAINNIATATLSTFIVLSSVYGQGSLTPPGAPAATMKTLEQVEPRIAIGTDTTPGDGSNLYKIVQPGSYYMATNLTGQSGVNGIGIDASGVTLDLMGFELTGVSGSLNGVNVMSIQTNICVRNGSIRNWGGTGVYAATLRNGQFESLRLAGNAQQGLGAGSYATVSQCAAYNNKADGISTGIGSIVRDCTSSENGGDGILASYNCSVSDCNAYQNFGNGISVGAVAVVRNCIVRSCSGNGIYLPNVGIVTGCLAQGNTLDGILVGGSGHVLNNETANNAIGIHFLNGGNGRVEANTCIADGIGVKCDTFGVITIRNNAGSYSMPDANFLGPTNIPPIISSSPWANF